jgi:histidinol-phosphate/aromatic aminotransferase/cobyric acid decarboxylase-like protein/choline kinase
MLPLSGVTHKTLLKVAGEPIIDRLIAGLRENSITNIVLVTGYRADELERHVESTFPDVRFTFVRNDKYETTNNIHSLALAFTQLDLTEDLILLESDLIYEPAVLRRLLKSTHDNVALVDRYRIGLDGTVVSLSEAGVITQVIPASLQGPAFDFSDKYKTLNIYKFSADFCQTVFSKLLRYYAEAIDDNCYYELILGILIYMQQVQIHAEELDGELWAEVDDPNDLRTAGYAFDPANRRKHLETSWGGYWNVSITDFAFIRNMYFPPDSMISQMRANLAALMHNYGSAQRLLDEKMANFLHCSAEHVVCLNGASQAFPILADLFDADRVTIPSPTFGEYTRIFPRANTYPDDGGFTAEIALDRSQGSDLIVVVSPNNPTGTVAGLSEIQKLVASAPTKTILVDESFIDFAEEPSIIPWLEETGRDNVVVLKSLSKALGVPGIRIGFAFSCNSKWNRNLRDQLPVWNINSVAEHFMEILLKYPGDLERSFTRTVDDRTKFADDLACLDVVDTVYPSGANFLLVRLAVDADRAAQIEDSLLTRDEIYVKNVSSKFRDGRVYWRLAVRSQADNRELCSAVSRSES